MGHSAIVEFSVSSYEVIEKALTNHIIWSRYKIIKESFSHHEAFVALVQQWVIEASFKCGALVMNRRYFQNVSSFMVIQ